jgi:alpha-glucuronidase
MLVRSREAVMNYMTPLGLAHIMATGHHYGPAPWARTSRADQSPVYYHRADTLGIGFDRTANGSNAGAQYAAPVRDRYANLSTVPDSLLLWFHRVPWTYRTRSGRNVWDELVFRYNAGVDTVRAMPRLTAALDHAVGDRFHVTVRSAGGDDHRVSDVRELPHVHDLHVDGFHVLEGGDGDLRQGARSGPGLLGGGSVAFSLRSRGGHSFSSPGRA